MQSFLTIVIAAVAAFFAMVIMPPETATNVDPFAVEEAPIILAETVATPVIIVEAVQPLVLALDADEIFDDALELGSDALAVVKD